MRSIAKVGVVGSGLMGSGIAEVFARSGFEVVVTEINRDALEAGRQRISNSLDRAVSGSKITREGAEAAASRVTYSVDLSALSDCNLIVEAATEDVTIKRSILSAIDKLSFADEDVVFASNTSSIPIARLGSFTSRPGNVLGIHFFNPAPVMPLVELVPSLNTSAEVTNRVEEILTGSLGKTVVRSRDTAGFIVNALLIPFLLNAMRMYESGIAQADQIDEAMRKGCGHPMGPLALADFIGLDTIRSIAEVLYTEFKEPLFASPPLLSRMVDCGWLGRKAGRGFYQYRQ